MSEPSKFERPPLRPYILGLDIGANSIGWVCLAAEPDGNGWEPTGLLHKPSDMSKWPTMGVRIFPVGVAGFVTGDEEGPAVKRRRARMMRRQTQRRARRMRKTFRILQESGLLPAYQEGTLERHGAPTGPEPKGRIESRQFRQARVVAEQAARDELLKVFDARRAKDWAQRLEKQERSLAYDHLPYLLRTRALSEKLPLEDLGRALYHLSQRRGFLSNRKDAASVKPGAKKPAKGSDDDVESLKGQMKALEKEIHDNNHRTLGEHLLWKLGNNKGKVRQLKTYRFLYRNEFDSIWDAQAVHYPDLLTTELRKRLNDAIFRQRKLRSQADKIGICSLEDGGYLRLEETGELVPTRPERRIPACSLLFQRFRAVQRVNDVRVVIKKTGEIRELEPKERQKLLQHLQDVKSLTAKEVGTVLGWGKEYVAQLNFDDETGSALDGCWTNQQLHEIFGDRWNQLTFDQREAIVTDLFEYEPDDWYEDDPDAPHREERARDPHIARRALSHEGPWGLLKPTRSEALRLIEVKLSSDYASLSRAAILRLLPLMESGLQYRHALDKCYRPKDSEALDYLPPVNKVFRSVNNPIVTRSLTELRKVMSHLIAYYGKPEQIRLELSRDIHQGKKGRDEARKGIEENRKRKEKAVKEYAEQANLIGQNTDNFRAKDLEKLRLWVEQKHVCPYTSKTISGSAVLSAEYEVDHIIPFSISQDDSYSNKVLVCARANQEKGNRTPLGAFGSDAERWSKIEGWVDSRRKKGDIAHHKLDRILMTEAQVQELLEQFKSRQLNDTRWASRWAQRYLMHLYGGNVVTGVDPKGRRRIQTSAGRVTADLRHELGLEGLLSDVIDPSVPRPAGRFSKRIDHRHHAVDAFAIAWFGPKAAQAMAKAAEAAPAARRRFYAELQEPWASYRDDIREALKACIPSHRVSNRTRGALHKETVYSPKTITSGERKSNLSVARGHRQRNVDHDGNHHVLFALQDSGDQAGPIINVVTYWEACQRVLAARKSTGRTSTDVPYLRPSGTLMTLGFGDTVAFGRSGSEIVCTIRIIRQDKVIGMSPATETRTPRSPPADADKYEKFLETNIPLSGLLVSGTQLLQRGLRKLSVSPIGVIRPARA